MAKNMGLITAPRFCGSNPPHTRMNLHLRISKCYVVIHVLCPWMTLLVIDGLSKHLAQGIWTIHMDEHEM